MTVDVEKLFKEFSNLSQVEAIGLGGSRATGRNDEKSDYDVYVYLSDSVDEDVRKGILEKYCKYMEIGNSFWELEDDVVDCVSWNGYTTCMWHNLITSKIVYDKTGKLNEMQKKYKVPYPEKLKENIILNNMKLLSGMLPSFDTQIAKAENRKDFVSVNHRVTEFLASYFDIIFALNEMTHPGGKRMQSICSKECKILPKNFDKNLNSLFNGMFQERISPVINEMVEEIKKIANMKSNYSLAGKDF